MRPKTAVLFVLLILGVLLAACIPAKSPSPAQGLPPVSTPPIVLGPTPANPGPSDPKHALRLPGEETRVLGLNDVKYLWIDDDRLYCLSGDQVFEITDGLTRPIYGAPGQHVVATAQGVAVFARQDGLTLRKNGENIQLSAQGSLLSRPIISSSKLFFLSWDDPMFPDRIIAYDFASRSEQAIARAREGWIISTFAMSPSGAKLFYLQTDRRQPIDRKYPEELMVLDLNTGVITSVKGLPRLQESYYTRLFWAGDYLGLESVAWAAPRNSTALYQVKDNALQKVFERDNFTVSVVDGDVLIGTVDYGTSWWAPTDVMELWRYSLKTGQFDRLTSRPEGVDVQQDWARAYDRIGDRVFMTRYRGSHPGPTGHPMWYEQGVLIDGQGRELTSFDLLGEAIRQVVWVKEDLFVLTDVEVDDCCSGLVASGLYRIRLK